MRNFYQLRNGQVDHASHIIEKGIRIVSVVVIRMIIVQIKLNSSNTVKFYSHLERSTIHAACIDYDGERCSLYLKTIE